MPEPEEKATPKEEGGGQAGGDGGPATESKHQPLTTDVGGPEGLHAHHAAVADAYMAHYARMNPWMNYAKSCYEAAAGAAGTPHGSVPGATNVSPPAPGGGATGTAGGDSPAVYEDRSKGEGEMKTGPIPASPQTPPFTKGYEPAAPAVPTDYAASQAAILYARVEQENKQLRERVAAIERDRKEARAQQYVTQWMAENYEFDPANEVKTLLTLPEGEWGARGEYIRKFHKKREHPLAEPVPYSGDGMVPIYRGRVETPAEDVSQRPPTADEARAAVLYCQSSDKPVNYDDALMMAKKGELRHLLKPDWRDAASTRLRR